MSDSPRHRALSVALLVVACLWSGTANANMAIPYLFIILNYAWMLLIPVVVIEAIVLKLLLSQTFSRMLGVSAFLNILSAILGVLVLVGLGMMLETMGFEMLSGWPAKVTFLVSLVPSFFITVWLEASIATSMFSEFSYRELVKTFAIANLCSYALLVILSMVITTPG